MTSNREIAVKLRAEVAQYERDMGRAAKATTGFAKSAQGALGGVKSAQASQADAAGQVRVAQLRLTEVQNNSKSSSAALAQAEENLASAQRKSSAAAEAVGAAQAEAAAMADKSSTAMGRLALSAEANRESWSQVGGVLMGAGAAITAVGTAAMVTGVQYNTLQQTTRAALTTLTGSAAAAGDQMDRLDDFARNSPFAKQTFIQAQQQMLGFGVAADKVLPALDSIQNTVAAFGGSNEQIASIAEIMSRIQSEGRLSGDALQRLGYYGVDAAELIGSQMGKTSAEIRDMASKPGGIPVAQIWDPLVQGMDQKFGGAAENVKETFAGAIDRVMAAWRDLSSELAAPFVGPEGGGIFTVLLNETADVMRAFQGLPGPVKATASYMTLAAGGASLLGGAFFLLAPRVLDSVDAMKDMGLWTDRTSSAVAGVTKSVTALATAFAAAKIAGEFLDNQEYATVNQYSSALLGLGDNAQVAAKQLDELASTTVMDSWADKVLGFDFGLGGTNASRSIESVGDAIAALDLNPLEQLEQFLVGSVRETSFDAAAESVGTIDEALASMVQSGNLDEAAQGFEYFAEQADEQGKSLTWVREQLPQYQDALAGAANEQKLAADAADEMASALETQAAAIGVTAEELTKMRDAAKSGADAVGQLGADFDYAEASAGDFIKHMQDQTKALQDFQRNAALAGQKGINEGLLMHLQSLGPEGAAMLAQFANASEAEIAKANAAWETHQSQLDRAKNAIDGIPNEKTARFNTPGLPEARQTVSELDRILRAMPLTRNIRINTIRTDTQEHGARAPGSFTGGRVPQGFAGGGVVPGIAPIDPRKDNVLAMGAQSKQPLMVRSGEWIINEKSSDANHEWLAAINGGLNLDDLFGDLRASLGIPGFANGGRLDRLQAQRRVRDLQRDLRERGPKGRLKLRGLDRQIAREELREARVELADLRNPTRVSARRDEIASARSDFMGNVDLSEGALRSPAAVERALQQSITDMAQFTMLLIELKKKGASPWLLQQLQGFGPSKGTIKVARAFLADNAKLRSVNALAAQAGEVSRIYGTVTTNPNWDATKAWSSPANATSMRTLNSSANITVNSTDPAQIAREVARLTKHYTDAQAMGAGI